MAKGKLIAANVNHVSNRQHCAPCSDCPWRRDSLPGWLGGGEPQEFIDMAHGEYKYPCHVIVNQQCAGMAIYRANVVKCPRDASILRLPGDTDKVFATPVEFLNHHERKR